MKTLIIENAKERSEPFLKIMDKLNLEREVWRPSKRCQTPPDISEIDRLVITGGPGHAANYLDAPYYQPTKKLIKGFIDLNKPILGICLGHQILALMLGGKVEQTNQRYGWIDISFSKPAQKNSIFDHNTKKLSVFHYHHDEVIQLPKDATLLATSKSCEIEAFTVLNKKIYGIQGHIEITPEQGSKILADIPRDLWAESVPKKYDPRCLAILEKFCKL